ncbi:hypothetical protein TNIN_118831 [Trichonephila inaurata madagascariensis]|uniref:Uncharacterized protein n=1 Tax=Trichonephila inaurata madagascariensis TaxID=2747483 RepID=A0A8X7CCC3_9ARAC|nr:hypothetical protein TNIN_118831 [Trichonephila inaurata madagascariensis]
MVEGFRYVHEIIFRARYTMVYTAVYYPPVKSANFSNSDSKRNWISRHQRGRNGRRIYGCCQGGKCSEDFVSPLPLFLVMKSFCTVSIVVMDMMYIPEWISKLSLEVFFYFAFIFVSLGILTVYAGNIPLEMSRIKAILLD